MKTLNEIINKEIRSHIDDIEVCDDLIVSSSENPALYDGVVSLAENIVEDLIKTNFKYLIALACDNYEDIDEIEPSEEKIEVSANVSHEDDEMLKFIAG